MKEFDKTVNIEGLYHLRAALQTLDPSGQAKYSICMKQAWHDEGDREVAVMGGMGGERVVS